MSEEVLELGTYEEVRNGVPLKFKVTTVPKDCVDKVIELMDNYFIPREPLCSHFKLGKSPEAVKSFNNFWRGLIMAGASLMAIREGPEDLKERIIGANVTYVEKKDDHVDIKTGDLFEYVTGLVFDLCSRVSIYEKYGVDKYLSAVGLSVDADYHGYNVGRRLLECRRPLCQILGIKVTATIFTNPISKHLAEKAGFSHLYEGQYSDYEFNGEKVLKDMTIGYAYSVLVFD